MVRPAGVSVLEVFLQGSFVFAAESVDCPLVEGFKICLVPPDGRQAEIIVTPIQALRLAQSILALIDAGGALHD